MNDLNFWIGIAGSLVLVAGAAYPSRKIAVAYKSVKNWLFTVGALIMLGFAILNYMDGGSIFFVILQIFINATSVMMMLNIPDKFDVPMIIVTGIAMIIWSLSLFEGYNTVFFIIGLSGIGMGYTFDGGSRRRELALMSGSLLIALFSYIEANWIFFWLNVGFSFFSALNLRRIVKR